VRWALLALACAACAAPTAPGAPTRCVYTDTVVFAHRGAQYAQTVEAFYHGARCDELAALYPLNLRWVP